MPNLLATLGQQYEIIAGTGIAETTRITFDGGAKSGATGTITLFTVSGLVAIKVYPYAEVVPVSAGGGTVALGSAALTTGLVTTTTATAIHADFDWIATPAALAADTTTNFPLVVTEENIILTIATATITAGRLRFTAIWRPLSPGALVTAVVAGSASPSLSPSASISASLSPSASASRSISPSSSVSPSSSASPSSSVSPSTSLSPSLSPSSSVSPSSSASASLSPSTSISPSLSPSSSASASISPSSSASASVSPSSSVSRSLSPSSSVSPSASQSF